MDKFLITDCAPHVHKSINEFKDIGLETDLYKNGEDEWVILARVGNFLIRRVIDNKIHRPELFEDYDACEHATNVSEEHRTFVEYLTNMRLYPVSTVPGLTTHNVQ